MDMVSSMLKWDRQHDRAAVDVAHKMSVHNLWPLLLVVVYILWKNMFQTFQ